MSGAAPFNVRRSHRFVSVARLVARGLGSIRERDSAAEHALVTPSRPRFVGNGRPAVARCRVVEASDAEKLSFGRPAQTS
jgi:hypothetical protein